PSLVSNATQSSSGFDNVGTWSVAALANGPTVASSGGTQYRVVIVPGTYTVTPKVVTVTAVGSNKVYDGTTVASVTLGHDGLIGDDLALAYGSASFADKNAGTGKQVMVSGITLGGADSGNYMFNTTAL